MKFLVVLHETRLDDGMGGEVEDPADVVSDVSAIHICPDTKSVCAALTKAEKKKLDWAVFEVVGSKAVRRSIVFKMDGDFPYDVEIR